MKLEKRDKFLTPEDVYFLTNGGRDIYEKYLGKVSKLMKSPWRRDRSPSFGVYSKGGIYYWKDIGTEESGTALQLVMKLFGLEYKDAMAKIEWDFSLGGRDVPAEHQFTNKITENSKPKHISVETMPFQKRHHEFWNAAEVTEAWCKKYDCYAIKTASIDRKRYYISPNEPVFGYYAPEEKHWKLYFPNRKGMQRFRNNISYHYLHGYNKLEGEKKLIIQKSPKDMIVTALLYPHVIATQAEHLKIFDEDTVKNIIDVAKDDIFIAYGSDEDGKRKSINISKQFNWKWVNPPNEYLPEVNDFYSLVKKYGLEELNKLLTNKGILC